MQLHTHTQAREGSDSGDPGGGGPRRRGVRARREAHRFVEGLARGLALLGVGDLARLAHLLKRLRWGPIAQACTRGETRAARGRSLRTSLKTFFWSSAIDAVKVKGDDFLEDLRGGGAGNAGRPHFKGVVATLFRAHLAAVAGGAPPSAEGAAAAGAALSFFGLDAWVLVPSKALASTTAAAIRKSATVLAAIAPVSGFRRRSVLVQVPVDWGC